MRKLLYAVAVIALSALGAGGVLYMDKHCPYTQAKMQKRIDEAISTYMQNHSQEILETLAKSDNFSPTVKNFSTISDEEISEKVRHYIAENQDIIEQFIRDNASFVATTVMGTEEFKTVSVSTEETKTNDEETSANAENQKYLDHWEEMRNSAVAPSVGPNDAKVAIVEFFDFACGHCKALAPVMSLLIKNNPDVKFVFQPLYFIGEHSNYAAKVAMAAHEKGKFLEVFEGIMTLPEMNEETINQILVDEDLNIDEIKKMIDEKKIRRGSQDIDALSQVLDINGVPMLFINGVPLYARNMAELQSKIDSYK